MHAPRALAAIGPGSFGEPVARQSRQYPSLGAWYLRQYATLFIRRAGDEPNLVKVWLELVFGSVTEA
jgi:hypothetical protein